ncbi:MAG: Gfo/Idh/MocA family oxidoreductase, partial [Candidatus Bathyarchaeia archaeon]
NRVLAVAENYRRAPKERAFWWAIREGLIGEPRINLWAGISWGPKPWGWREDKFAAGGSWVFDGGVHWADLDRYQLNREAVEVFAMCHTFDPIKEGVKVTVDDMTMAIIRYEKDVFSQWIWTRAAPAKRAYTHTIYGSRGALSDDGIHIETELGRVETRSIGTLIEEMRRSLPKETLEKFFPRGITDTFAIELYDFYDAIVSKRKPEVDGIEAYKDMAIPLGFYESAKINKPVRIKDVEDLLVEEYQREINEKLSIT